MTDNNKALDQLYSIIELESDGFQSGKLIRQKALTKWIDKWIEIIKSEQSIVNKKYLHGPHEEEMKELLALKMIDTVTEYAVQYNIKDTSVESRMMVVRRNGRT